MNRSVLNSLRSLAGRLGLESDWYIVFAAGIMGILMGGVATAFILPIKWIEEYTATRGQTGIDAFWCALIALAPPIGALLTGIVIRLFHTDTHGTGVTAVMYAINREKARLPLRLAAGKWIGSTLTIGSGGSTGAEGPIVTIGSTLGSNVGRWLRATPQNTATLLGCGAAAGISSVFNAPIAGIFFVLEVMLRDFSLRTFTPIVIASVISAAATKGLLGDLPPLFPVPDNFIGDRDTFGLAQVPILLLLGIACGLLAPGFSMMLQRTDHLFERWRLSSILKPAVGGALLGLIGLTYILIVREPGLPPFFGNGYPVIDRLLAQETYTPLTGDQPTGALAPLVTLLFGIVALKAVGTCLTLGSGGAGGVFAPSLLMGAALGGLVGVLVQATSWLPAGSPPLYALVGMGAMIAGTMHAPLTGIMLGYEITGRGEVLLPLMLASVIAVVVSRLIRRDSIYTWKLSRLGVRLGVMSDLTILRRLSVSDVPLASPIVVHPHESAQRLLDLSKSHAAVDFVVTDDDGRYNGLVVGADLRTAILEREAIPLLLISELVRANLPTVTSHDTLDIVLDRFSRHDVHSLAVLDASGNDAVIGVITRDQLMRRYQEALSED